jgi:hypothetical protein
MSQERLETLERQYVYYDTYVWLARHFLPHMFPDLDNAVERRTKVLDQIQEGLQALPASKRYVCVRCVHVHVCVFMNACSFFCASH